MSTKTRVELIHRAAKLLALIEPGEAPSTEDYNALDGLIDPLIDQLTAEQVYYFDDPDAIDSSVFEPLARLLANIAGPEFGSAINEEAQMRDQQILRRIGAAQPTYVTIKSQYY